MVITLVPGCKIDGFPPVKIQSGIFVLEYIIVERFVFGLFAKKDFVSIHIYQIRFSDSLEDESINLMFSPYFITFFICTLIDINC